LQKQVLVQLTASEVSYGLYVLADNRVILRERQHVNFVGGAQPTLTDIKS